MLIINNMLNALLQQIVIMNLVFCLFLMSEIMIKDLDLHFESY